MKTSIYFYFTVEAAKLAMGSWFVIVYMHLSTAALCNLLQGISIDSAMYFGRHRREKCG